MVMGADVPPPPASDHESNSLMAEEAEPAGDDAKGMKLDSVAIRKAANGGFIVNCNKSPVQQGGAMSGPGYSSKDYAFSSIDEVIGYLQKELA